MDVDSDAQKPGVVSSRGRRALGDITNASASETGPSGVKKAATGTGITDQVHRQYLGKPPSLGILGLTPTLSYLIPLQGPVDAVDRPYMRRPADDIDERDAENPLLCTEVVNQMYDHFGEAEKGTHTHIIMTYTCTCVYVHAYIHSARFRCSSDYTCAGAVPNSHITTDTRQQN